MGCGASGLQGQPCRAAPDAFCALREKASQSPCPIAPLSKAARYPAPWCATSAGAGRTGNRRAHASSSGCPTPADHRPSRRGDRRIPASRSGRTAPPAARRFPAAAGLRSPGHQPVDVDRLAAGLLVGAEHRMRRLGGGADAAFAAQRRAVIVEMQRAAAVELRLDGGIERVVGGSAAGEQRVAAIGRDLERIQQRAVVRHLGWIMS